MPISWILPRARAMFPDRPAILDGEVRHTFGQLGHRVDALVGAFKANGVKQGDRVAILDVNSSRYAEAYYACAQAGMVLVPLNSRLAPLGVALHSQRRRRKSVVGIGYVLSNA